VQVDVVRSGQVLDRAETTFGIRSIQIDAENGFVLNGQRINLKGGCVHHDNGLLGAESYARSEERKVELLKASGYNAVRCAHNPPATAFLEACDRLGMLVMDEAFDCWRTGKNPGDYHTTFDDWWQRDLDSMLYRDRNHPSIFAWSIGNEVSERFGLSNGAGLARMLAGRVREVDPTRPVTSAINGMHDGRPWELTDAVFSALDLGGYNYQWVQYEPDHERHPQRVMAGTESFPIEAFENWQCVVEHPYVIGDFVWTSLDYLGEAGIGRVHFDGEQAPFLGVYPWHQANCGDIDICGFKRPQSYYRDILWKEDARPYIAVHTPVPEGKTPTITRWGWPDVWPEWNWPGYEGQPFQVDVYSPGEEVELFLNGISLGRKPASRQEKHIAAFKVPYEPGEMKAVSYRDGKTTGEAVIRTANTPTAIRLSPDSTSLQAVPGELCYITVEIVDSEGNLHPTYEANVLFSVQGEGAIAAVGSSNPVSTELYRGNQRKTYHGRCMVVVKTGGLSGEIHLRASADYLEGAEVTIQVMESR
jgi:beta-galactosidase